MPISTPMLVASSATLMPTISDTRPPHSTRENTSRPIASVPKKFVALGAFSRCSTFISIGLYGAIHGASSAISAMIASSTPPITSSGWRRTKDHHGSPPCRVDTRFDLRQRQGHAALNTGFADRAPCTAGRSPD